MAALRRVESVNRNSTRNSVQLSSGDRIVRSAYDPSGLAISEKMRSNIRSMGQAKRNINDGISLLQVAEGSLSIMGDIGGRLRELAMQASTDTIGDSERQMADVEFQNLKEEISRLAKSTKFNGNHILNSNGSVYDLQVGINNNPEHDRLVYDMNKALNTVSNIGIDGNNIKTKYSARNSLKPLSDILNNVSTARAQLGSVSNRMDAMMQNLDHYHENLSRSKSVIRDTDVALASSDKAKLEIQRNASIAMLGQANHRPEKILSLL